MRLVVISHKPCWPSDASTSGFATDGGFPLQMAALAELFDATTLLIPTASGNSREGEMPLEGHNIAVKPLSPPSGRGLWRKLALPFWLARNSVTLFLEVWRADAVHAPIPGDVGTFGLLLALLLRKPLLVRHCGNWLAPVTRAERFWIWLMEQFAGGRNVMLATGGGPTPPSPTNPNIHWIFSTSLSTHELNLHAKRRLKLPGPAARLVIACRQDPQKGTGTVIESFRMICDDFDEATLDVIGDGAALNEFKEMARNLGVEERVVFHGKVDHDGVIALLREADLFCYPTTASEGFPKVVLEALACGLPVVTTKVSVLPELIGKGSGILLDDSSPETLAEATRRALSNEAEYVAMSDCAIATAERYSLENWRDAIASELRRGWGETARLNRQIATSE